MEDEISIEQMALMQCLGIKNASTLEIISTITIDQAIEAISIGIDIALKNKLKTI